MGGGEGGEGVAEGGAVGGGGGFGDFGEAGLGPGGEVVGPLGDEGDVVRAEATVDGEDPGGGIEGGLDAIEGVED